MTDGLARPKPRALLALLLRFEPRGGEASHPNLAADERSASRKDWLLDWSALHHVPWTDRAWRGIAVHAGNTDSANGISSLAVRPGRHPLRATCVRAYGTEAPPHPMREARNLESGCSRMLAGLRPGGGPRGCAALRCSAQA